jgi:hypothetical protein
MYLRVGRDMSRLMAPYPSSSAGRLTRVKEP